MREFGIWNPKIKKIFFFRKLRFPEGIRNSESEKIKKYFFLIMAILGCWFQKQALEQLKISALVLYIVTIALLHHLIMLWSTQGVGVIIKSPCKGLQEWTGQLVVKDTTNNDKNRL